MKRDTTVSVNTSTLRAADVAAFEAIGVTKYTLALAGVRRVSHAEARALCGITYKSEHLEGIAFPYFNPEDGERISTWRVRRDHPELNPDGTPRAKYLSPPDRKRLYFGPDCCIALADTTIPAIIVEAEKSVLSVADAENRGGRRRGLLIGLGGCYGWSGTIGKTEDAAGTRVDVKGPIADLDRVAWTGRDVIIVFDANIATNTKVRAARRALGFELTKRGAKVRLVNLPIEVGINGPDDFIGRRGPAAFWELIDNAQPADTTSTEETRPRLVHLTKASLIKVRPVRWLWEGRMALGTLGLLGGREGVGKTICAYTVSADITRGQLPGAYAGSPRAVIVAATEDSWEHTIVPRLMAAGADLELVYRVDVVTAEGSETAVSLPKDLVGLEQVIRDVDAAAIILDPLLSRLDSALDTHKDAEVRLALEPLVALAAATDTCVLGLIHVNKSASADALTLLMGSRAFAAVARAVLFVMVDPDDENLRLLGQAKNNLGRCDLPTLAFRIVGTCVAETDEGPVWTGKLEWLGETDRTINEAVDAAAVSSGDRSATSDAVDWLLDYLTSEGGTLDSAVVQQAGRQAGHSKNTLHRARKRLRILSEQKGFPRKAYWSLPPTSSVGPLSGESESTGTTGTTGTTERQWAQSAHSSQSFYDPPRARTTKDEEGDRAGRF